MSIAPGLSSILAPSQTSSTRSAATGDDLGTYREDACAPPSADLLASPSTSSSASAAAARSLALYLGFLFRRPSKLFRPSRVDTWGGLRHLALSADQTLSPTFIRNLVKSRSGLAALLVTVFPPLLVNTALGFLLFTSHSLFSLCLAKLDYFRGTSNEQISLETLLQGPDLSTHHPTMLSGIAGAGAGVVQGIAFTPVENLVRLLRDSATSLSGLLIRTLRLPIRADSPLQSTASPLEGIRSFISSSSWRQNSSWWAGWRWTVARDAVSYACFFAAFDLSRRTALRIRGMFSRDDTMGRVAQAGTIVAGGVSASLVAEVAGRPFREAQRLARQQQSVRQAIRHDWRPFLRNTQPKLAGSLSRRVAWRLAAVGPWGFGFLVWAWVGGEV